MDTDILQQLKQRPNCDVVTPRNGEYDAQRPPFLLAIVNAESAGDIAQTIRFARENDLELAVQNTGHGEATENNIPPGATP